MFICSFKIASCKLAGYKLKHLHFQKFSLLSHTNAHISEEHKTYNETSNLHVLPKFLHFLLQRYYFSQELRASEWFKLSTYQTNPRSFRCVGVAANFCNVQKQTIWQSQPHYTANARCMEVFSCVQLSPTPTMCLWRDFLIVCIVICTIPQVETTNTFMGGSVVQLGGGCDSRLFTPPSNVQRILIVTYALLDVIRKIMQHFSCLFLRFQPANLRPYRWFRLRQQN